MTVEHTLFFANFLALLSLLFLNNSITRRSYGARPATSLTISRTKAVRLLKWPLVREMRGLRTRGVVFYSVGHTMVSRVLAQTLQELS